jgi:ATP-binding cassette subfamily B protein
VEITLRWKQLIGSCASQAGFTSRSHTPLVFDASLEEIQQAAKDACIHESIEGFPHVYHSMVGERGVTLSGGQRQRIALARALLKNPPILILDDSLSAVDTDTESQILRALKDRRQQQTTIIVAHRLSTVMHADKILVLNRGRVVQEGSHEQLKDQAGIYRQLCEIQGAIQTQIEQDINHTQESEGAFEEADQL